MHLLHKLLGIDKNTLLLKAAKNGKTQKLLALFNKGADLNARDKAQGWTALMYAIDGGHTQAAKVLIELKADVNLTAETGTSALMVAAINENVELVHLLLAAGARTASREMHGRTALELVDYKCQLLGQHVNKELLTVREILERGR